MKSSLAEQDTLMECNKGGLFFNIAPATCDPHTSSIGVAVLGSHWQKNQLQIGQHHMDFSAHLRIQSVLTLSLSLSLCIYIYIYVYIYL